MERPIVYYAPLSEAQRQRLATQGWVVDDNGNMLTPEKAAALDAQRAENEAARRRYLDGLGAEKRADQERRDAELDVVLAPRKQIERHKWLAAHPDRTANDFEATWREHLRPVAVAELEDERTRQTVASLAASGRYTM